MPILKFPTTRNLLACSIEGLIWLASVYVVKRRPVSGDFSHLVRVEELVGHLSMSVLPSVVVISSVITMEFGTGEFASVELFSVELATAELATAEFVTVECATAEFAYMKLPTI